MVMFANSPEWVRTECAVAYQAMLPGGTMQLPIVHIEGPPTTWVRIPKTNDARKRQYAVAKAHRSEDGPSAGR